MIKQLLNSVITKYRDLSVSRRSIIMLITEGNEGNEQYSHTLHISLDTFSEAFSGIFVITRKMSGMPKQCSRQRRNGEKTASVFEGKRR